MPQKAGKIQRAPETSTSGNGVDINELPQELLLRIFQELGNIGPSECCSEQEFTTSNRMPFRTLDCLTDPHPGLRSYPFLGQVCRRWKDVLCTPFARNSLWQEVVIDFGHELITAVHTPIAWSDKRPSDEEFKTSFSQTRLSAKRILDFVRERQQSVERIVLMNSEGYYSEEGDFVNLTTKHNFSLAHFGFLCGMLQTTLREVVVQHCNDFFATAGAFPVLSCLGALRSLHIEDLHCHVDNDGAAELARLPQLTELSITAEINGSNWHIGLDRVPSEWSQLTNLRTLELRGHNQLTMLPAFLRDLPLEHLDVSYCRMVKLDLVTSLTRLSTLALQGHGLVETFPSRPVGAPPDPEPKKLLPCLDFLRNLTALNLSDNLLTTLPAVLAKLPKLRFLDLNSNATLKVTAPLTHLSGLTDLRLMDVRVVHIEPGQSYWGEAKCDTMRHLAAFHKLLRRKNCNAKVLMDMD